MQLQALEREASPKMFCRPRIIVNPAASLQAQGLEVPTESERSKPPAVHPVVGDGELLKHRAAAPHSRDAVVAPLATHKLQLHQPLAAMREDGEADVGDATALTGAVEGRGRGDYAEDLEVREGGDRAEGEVGAAVELELLQRRASAGDGHEPAGLGGGGGGEAAEVGEAGGDGGEAPVERVVVEEPAGAERRVGAGV